METSEGAFAVSEFERDKKSAEVSVLAELGLGFGNEQGISPVRHIEDGEFDQASYEATKEILISDDEVYVTISDEADDDGCGDGRFTARIYKLLNPETNHVQTFKRSLVRAKLFGGGLIAAASMWRMVDGVAGDKTLDGDRSFMASKLKDRGISYGAHTDNHAEGEACGCGAIDKYELISRNVTAYQSEILNTLPALYDASMEENSDAVTTVLEQYESLSSEYFAGTTGRGSMDSIEKEGAVVKELGGKHLEGYIVINTVDNTTLDQDKLREKLIEQGYSPNVQVFVVDEWRGRMYANVVAEIAAEQDKDRDEAYKVAYADFLIRTLAVSATLTKGDLPVLIRQPQAELVSAA